ncbi:MAG TPA: polysaccharide deacetylase family protein [Mycobacteriales bacterium]|nr:polysaccharide deacetylase family protein [Mycobacteriales bacterium]
MTPRSALSSGREVTLCFHGIGEAQRSLEPGEAEYWVDVDLFERVLDLCTVQQSVTITFDDGNASDVQVALPLLLERNLTASFFPVAGRIDTAGSLRSADLRELTSHGMIVGTHGMNHRSWRKLSTSEIETELGEARRRISDAIGTSVEYAACPLGGYDRRSLTALRKRGYERVYTSDRNAGHRGSWLQPRFSIRNSDDPSEVLSWIAKGSTLSSLLASTRTTFKSWR